MYKVFYNTTATGFFGRPRLRDALDTIENLLGTTRLQELTLTDEFNQPLQKFTKDGYQDQLSAFKEGGIQKTGNY